MMSMAYTLVIYDISDDTTRRKAADICLANGLERIQRSAYVGRIPRLVRKNLLTRLENLPLEPEDSILLLIISTEEYERGVWIHGKHEGPTLL